MPCVLGAPAPGLPRGENGSRRGPDASRTIKIKGTGLGPDAGVAVPPGPPAEGGATAPAAAGRTPALFPTRPHPAPPPYAGGQGAELRLVWGEGPGLAPQRALRSGFVRESTTKNALCHANPEGAAAELVPANRVPRNALKGVPRAPLGSCTTPRGHLYLPPP
eukprot:gene15586-biopygen6684